jgi:MoaA/NifB/PqqE/SkfB family radical SAM enzyme
MKLRNLVMLGLAALTAGLGVHAQGGSSDPGYVDFGKFAPPSSGGEFVEVQIKNNLIAMVARLAQTQEPEVAELLRGLRAVRVNVIGLTEDNRTDIRERIAKLRAELETKGWERVVTAQKDNEDVGVYVKTRGEEAVEGIVVTVLDGQREAVFVNIVGDIKPEKLSSVGERFNIEPLKKIGQPAQRS